MNGFFCFKCNRCGVGIKVSLGVPSSCYCCGSYFELIRISPEEYNNLETNEGNIITN